MIRYLFLVIGLIVLLGWLFPLISGIVRIKKKTGGKGRLVFGVIWGVLALLFIIYFPNNYFRRLLAESIQKRYRVEVFNPAAYHERNLGKIALPFKGESSLVLRNEKNKKQIRFNTTNGLFQAPTGEYSISSWSGTITARDTRKSKWMVSSYSTFPLENRHISVATGSTLELNDAIFNCFNHTPELKITTKPDPKKKGNTGIELKIVAGDVNLYYLKEINQIEIKEINQIEAVIEVKTEDGKIAHKGTARIDKFSFG